MKYIGPLLVTITSLIVPISGLLTLMFCCCFLDFLSGIYASIKTQGFDSITSHKFFNSVIKLFFYMGTILMGYMVDKYLIGITLFNIPLLGTKIMTLLWCWVEIQSINENSIRIGNRSIWTIISDMIGRFKNIKKDIQDK